VVQHAPAQVVITITGILSLDTSWHGRISQTVEQGEREKRNTKCRTVFVQQTSNVAEPSRSSQDVMMSLTSFTEKKEMRFVSLSNQDTYVVPFGLLVPKDITPDHAHSVPAPMFYSKGFPPLPKELYVYISSRCNTACKPKTKVCGHAPKADKNDEYFCVWGIDFPFLFRASSHLASLAQKVQRKNKVPERPM
jgi:hypothetical protein